jgi:hypothetical protein
MIPIAIIIGAGLIGFGLMAGKKKDNPDEQVSQIRPSGGGGDPDSQPRVDGGPVHGNRSVTTIAPVTPLHATEDKPNERNGLEPRKVGNDDSVVTGNDSGCESLPAGGNGQAPTVEPAKEKPQ